MVGDKLTLSKIGTMRIRLSREIVGKIKTCAIKREVSDWFVIFTVEAEDEIWSKTGEAVGIDVGIENFATLSNGEKIPNHKYFEFSQKNLRIAQRSVSRKKSASRSRQKAIGKLRKIHQKIKNQRNDFAHKISTKIVNKFDFIAIEDLNIHGLGKGILSKQIYDAGWNNLYRKLICKAENAGKKLIKVKPHGTSQTCICGASVKKSLSVRWHFCPQCGYQNHRDIVAAQVILQRAGSTLSAQTKAIELRVVGESV